MLDRNGVGSFVKNELKFKNSYLFLALNDFFEKSNWAMSDLRQIDTHLDQQGLLLIDKKS